MITQKPGPLTILLLLLFFATYPPGNYAQDEKSLSTGQQFFEQGNFAKAIEHWKNVLKNKELTSITASNIHLYLSLAYQALGDYNTALLQLEQALELAEQAQLPEQILLIDSTMSDVLLALQRPEEAEKRLINSLNLVKSLDKPLLQAHLLNNWGNLLSIRKEYEKASVVYQQVIQLAQQSQDNLMQIQGIINQIQASLKLEQAVDHQAHLKSVAPLIASLPDHFEKGFYWLSLGQLALRLKPSSDENLLLANSAFEHAFSLAEQLSNQHLKAYALGFLGQVYERQHSYLEALRVTRQAVFFSQDKPDILYFWEGQLGQLLVKTGDLDGALITYQQAFAHLNPIQTRLVTGQRDPSDLFREQVRPIYFGLADVMLRKASSSGGSQQKLLNQVLYVLEQLKAAELQDYFQDECVSGGQKAVQLDNLASDTAIIYPILLPDRVEILTNVQQETYQATVSVSLEEVAQNVLEFRQNLQTSTHYRFAEQADKLYQWFISPLRSILEKHHVNTLIIIPDGFLRTIPLAALYNAEQRRFLIEEFAIAITPGLNLTEPTPIPRDKISIFLNGLSLGVQNFSPLPNVPKELDSIQALFSDNKILLDQNFLLSKVNQTLQKTPYSIVHIASHGQFDSDPKKTFLLTYDGKLTMDKLESLLRFTELRKDPIELLTLSACQTALGDERAALGLAGVAVKAGAKSALASLWFVNDESTAGLITEFYNQLKNSKLSKAQALQNAQKKLISEHTFRHPVYWAAFLLIGNWL